jgi:hypothetical protein
MTERWRKAFASSEQVRERMSGLARRDTGPEIALRRALHQRGLRYYVHRRPLPELRREADVVSPKRSSLFSSTVAFGMVALLTDDVVTAPTVGIGPKRLSGTRRATKTLMPSCASPDGFPFECGSTRNLKARQRGFFHYGENGQCDGYGWQAEPSSTLLPLIPRISRGRSRSCVFATDHVPPLTCYFCTT